MTLREVPVHTTVKVVKINGEGAFRRRIMDMGITKNSEIYVRKVAPLGDPVEITVRGYELSLRRAMRKVSKSLQSDDGINVLPDVYAKHWQNPVAVRPECGQ